MSQLSGQDLKKLRETKGLSLEQAARDLRLRLELLQSLENSADIEILPDVYHKLSLQMYARYLGMTLPGNRPLKRSTDHVALSPVDGCVELAYSEKIDEKVAKPQHRSVGAGTIIAAAAIVVLATGLWSLNAKLARLSPAIANPAVAQATPTPAPTPAPTTEPVPAASLPLAEMAPPEQVTLEEELYLSLTPDAPPAEITWH